MKILVTGGTGFVGTHVVNRLLQDGHAVAVLARSAEKTQNRYNQTVDRVHREAVENVIAAAHKAGVRRLLHMSAMGSSSDSPSEYGRTKAAGEAAVRGSGLDWTVFRPSIIFGPGDGFVSLLAPI